MKVMMIRVAESKYYPYPMEVVYAKARLDNPLFFVVGNIYMVVNYPSSEMTEDMIDTIIVIEENELPLWEQAMQMHLGQNPRPQTQEMMYHPDRARRQALTDYDKVVLYQLRY